VVIVAAASSSGSATLVGIVVGVAAGAIAALITGFFQGRNTDRTIAAEQARLDATLAAERERLETRLSFERGETDRAELRGLLDELAAHLSALWSVSGRLEGMVKSIVEPGVDDEDNDEFEALHLRLISEVADNLSTERTAAGDNIDQLKLRLGAEGQRLVGAARLVWFSAGWICKKAVDSEPSPEILARIRKDRKTIEDYRETFNARALKFTQARLHRPDQDGRAVAPNHGDASQPPNDVSLQYRPDEAFIRTFLRRRRTLADVLSGGIRT
jgi:gas vesicle protein